jgi:hypothetical protein
MLGVNPEGIITNFIDLSVSLDDPYILFHEGHTAMKTYEERGEVKDTHGYNT